MIGVIEPQAAGSGFDLVKQPTAGPKGVAWEFTGQAVALMRYVDRLYGESRFATQAAPPARPDCRLEAVLSAAAASPGRDSAPASRAQDPFPAR